MNRCWSCSLCHDLALYCHHQPKYRCDGCDFGWDFEQEGNYHKLICSSNPNQPVEEVVDWVKQQQKYFPIVSGEALKVTTTSHNSIPAKKKNKIKARVV